MNTTKIQSNNEQQKKHKSSRDIVGTFLSEIGRFPILNAEQEIQYGKKIQQMLTLLETKEKLKAQLNREPTIGEWANKMQLSQETLSKQLQQGRIAKQKMIVRGAMPERTQKRAYALAERDVSTGASCRASSRVI